jgi:hypothetical protein
MRRKRCIVVVSDPALEQIAEDVQRVGGARLGGEQTCELPGYLRTGVVEVQI